MINTVSCSHAVVVVLGGGGVKCIYTYRHFSRYLHMYVDTHNTIFKTCSLSLSQCARGEKEEIEKIKRIEREG